MIMRKRQADCPRLGGLEVHAFEIDKLHEWPLHRRAGTTNVHLGDFIAIAAAGVGDIERNCDLTVALKRLTAEPKVLVLKRGIAQPMAEWIQRLAAEVHISAAKAEVVIVEIR